MNQLEIIGTLADEPKMREGPNGPIAAFTVVTKYQRPAEAGGMEDATQYHRVAVFNPKLAALAEGLQAGTAVHLKGAVKLEKYKSEERGEQMGCEIHVAGQYGRFQRYEGDAATANRNRFRIVGNLGAAPVIKDGPDGPMAFFSVATTERWTDKGGTPQENTTWHQAAVFEPGLAAYARDHLTKGSFVRLEGEIRHGKYLDESGASKSTTQIHLSGPDAQLMLQPLSQSQSGSRRNSTRRDDNTAGLTPAPRKTGGRGGR